MADYISRGGSQQKPAQPLNHNFLLHRRASSSASPASWLLRVISAKYLQRRATCRWTSEHAAPPQSSADRPFHWIPCSLCFSCGQQSLYHPPARTQPPGAHGALRNQSPKLWWCGRLNLLVPKQERTYLWRRSPFSLHFSNVKMESWEVAFSSALQMLLEWHVSCPIKNFWLHLLLLASKDWSAEKLHLTSLTKIVRSYW